LGNALDPWDVLERQGADALRWFMVTVGSPWEPRRIGHEVLDEIVRQFMLTLWNVYAFFVTYANAEGFDPSEIAPLPPGRPALDRWALSQLAGTVRTARDGLETYDATGAGRRIAAFVDDLSNWYVRRARRRFWNPARDGGERDDVRAAFHTLHTCLVTVAQLLAPFTPFVAEELWQTLVAGRDDAPVSVHLSDYPVADDDAFDPTLNAAMIAARAIVELGRRVRVETKTRTRQPLAEAVVHYAGDHEALSAVLPLVAEELNVKRVVFAESDATFGRWRAKPNYKVLGPKLGGAVKKVAAALADDDGTVASALARGEEVSLPTEDEVIALTLDDVDMVQEVTEGWGVASEGGLTVALDLEVTDDLRLEGQARELVRAIQDARRAAGLDVSDRIELAVAATGDVAESFDAFRGYVAGETLAVSLDRGTLDGEAFRHEVEIDGGTVSISLRRAGTTSP
jgi:isoleucyl-tRNA synthetase